MMKQDPVKRGKSRYPAFLKIALAVGIVAILTIVLLLAMPSYWLPTYGQSISFVYIRNESPPELLVQSVQIDDQIIWRHDVIKPKRGMYLEFRCLRKPVELKLMTVNELGERATASCTLDVRLLSCIFDAHYVNGTLTCTDCVEHMD
jgi:hypothetical protein